jgi:cytochrome c oxidase accessory protein FixG
MCPYARFQGAMFDRDTLLVAYDGKRGEPRGARRKQHAIIPIAANVGRDDKPQGACVDCGLCVQVCPTGIDIRDGLQYECIGCAACIDVCDEVMDKTGQARGLIRFSTQHAMEQQQPLPSLRQRPRALVYSGLLLAIVALSATGLALRVPFKVDILRDRAVMQRESNDGYIENVYNVRIMNTERDSRRYQLQVESAGLVRVEAPPLQVAGDSVTSFNVALVADPALLPSGSHTVSVRIVNLDDPSQVLHEEARLLMP